MLAMFLAYRVFLAKESQHGYNRTVLLLIYIISFTAIPVLSFLERVTLQVSNQKVVVGWSKVTNTVGAQSDGLVWGTVFLWFFLAGMVVITINAIITWLRLIHIVCNGEKIEREGFSIIIMDNERFAPFSWIKYVVISRTDYYENYSAIVTHELTHVACHHWIDLLLAQVVCIINWFNPAAWLMRDELMLVHEYQADKAVIDSGNNPQQYQMLLIKKAVGTRFPSFANSLNHSKLKKRITMMYQEKSGARRKFKALALLPALAMALGVGTTPTIRAALTTINNSEISVSKGSENSATDKTGVHVFQVKNLNNDNGKTTITIWGEGLGDHINVSGGTFTTKGKTYRATALNCNLTNGLATIVASFPFIDEFDNSSMTLTINGEEVPFNLEKFFDNAAASAVVSEVVPEVQPQYPGGESAMYQAIMSKVTFPDPGRKWKEGATGLTLVRFTVMPDGSMSNIEPELSCGYGDLDQIAIDAVKNGLTKKWTPGTVDGVPVAVEFSIPIRFKVKSVTKK